ncbi:MAG: hypothetical protein J0H98_06925 [Solirubrobacterales bacterium]|nr:hypothetical protein [Solirubrobacterales bacterium]
MLVLGALGGSAAASPGSDFRKDHETAAKAWAYAEKTWPNQYAGVWGVDNEKTGFDDFVFAFTARPGAKVAELRQKFPTKIASYVPARRTYSKRYLDGLLSQMITDRSRILHGRLKPPGKAPGRFDLGMDMSRNKVNLYKPFFAPGYKRWFKHRYGQAILFVKSGLAQWE